MRILFLQMSLAICAVWIWGCEGEVAQSPCKTGECPQGQWCNLETGNCEPGCEYNNDCETPTPYCVDHQCLSCEQTGCKENQICNTQSGICEWVDLGCEDNSDCSEPTPYCKDGECVSCYEHGHCHPPQPYCYDYRCQSCTDVGCSEGYVCNEQLGECEVESTVECNSDLECQSPTPYCVQGECQGCSTAGCPGGGVCNQQTGYCEDQQAECSTDADCSSPNPYCRVVDGQMRCVGCLDIECPAGQQCNTSTGYCEQTAGTTGYISGSFDTVVSDLTDQTQRPQMGQGTATGHWGDEQIDINCMLPQLGSCGSASGVVNDPQYGDFFVVMLLDAPFSLEDMQWQDPIPAFQIIVPLSQYQAGTSIAFGTAAVGVYLKIYSSDPQNPEIVAVTTSGNLTFNNAGLNVGEQVSGTFEAELGEPPPMP